MNALLFKQYLREASIYGRMQDHAGVSIDLAFVVALFGESKKRRMHEGERNLIVVAAASMVAEHSADFNEWRRERQTGFFYAFGPRDFEILASEVASFIKGSNAIKLMVTQWPRDERNELLGDVAFGVCLGDFEVEEHPLQTFVSWLDYIEGMKGKTEYAGWLALKRNLTNCLRVGNAIFDRSAWQSTVEKSREGKR